MSQQKSSLGALLIVLAATVVVLAGIHAAAALLNPILFAYIPYIGTFLAAIPPVILALAEFGLLRALLVILGFTAANIMAENILSPLLMSRGLSLSPTVVFLSFAFWVWLLGGPGAFLAMPLTFLLILLLDSFGDSRWLVNVLMVRSPDTEHSTKERSPSGLPPHP